MFLKTFQNACFKNQKNVDKCQKWQPSFMMYIIHLISWMYNVEKAWCHQVVNHVKCCIWLSFWIVVLVGYCMFYCLPYIFVCKCQISIIKQYQRQALKCIKIKMSNVVDVMGKNEMHFSCVSKWIEMCLQ